jgi:hypothetical protein
MGIRNTFEKHPRIAATAAALFIAAAVIWIAVFDRAGSGATNQTKLFYTVDDGATLFADDIGKQPPFEHDGKQAVLALVYTCDGGKTQFVQCLKKQGTLTQLPAGVPQTAAATWLVKKPGSKNWIPLSDPTAASLFVPSCPAGGRLDEVLP